MTSYQVVRPAVLVQDGNGAQHMLYEKAVFDDAGYNADHVKMLKAEGFIEKFVPSEPSADEKSDRVDDILAEVGDDKDKAAAALETERAGKNRSTLIGALEKIVAA